MMKENKELMKKFMQDQSPKALASEDFNTQKGGVRIVTYDKLFYNKEDKQDLAAILNFIKNTFVERGTRTMKKQLLSSKEKEVWICECGKTNDIGTYCSGCSKDIFGFKENEVKPQNAYNYIQQKIELITEQLEAGDV